MENCLEANCCKCDLPVTRQSSLSLFWSWPGRLLGNLLGLTAMLFLLGGCSRTGIAYDHGPTLAFHWLDSYADFDDAQSTQIRAALDEWFAWHRSTQLVEYAELVVRAENDVLLDTTPKQACVWSDDLRRQVNTAVEHAEPAIAVLAATLTAKQLGRLEKQLNERDLEYRKEHLQTDSTQRFEAEVKRQSDRFEAFYGRLASAQIDLIAQEVANSPYDANCSYMEIVRRQQDAISVLRHLSMATPGELGEPEEIHRLVERIEFAPRGDARDYAEQMRDFNCRIESAVHNSTSRAQRNTAAERLKSYEINIRRLTQEVNG